jgi:hypothetical protein
MCIEGLTCFGRRTSGTYRETGRRNRLAEKTHRALAC